MKPVSNSKAKFVQAILEAVMAENASSGRQTNISCIVSVDGVRVSDIGVPLRSSVVDLKAQMVEGDPITIQTIVLNVSFSAVRFLRFDDNCVSAQCRVHGQETSFIVPLPAIMKISTPGYDDLQTVLHVDLGSLTPIGGEPTEEEKVEPKRPTLTVVK